MGDLIDKEKFIYTLIFSEKTKSIFVKDLRSVIEVVNEMPSAEPEAKWIPVTESLPEDGERVLTTIEVGSRGKKVRSGTYFKSLFQCDNGDVWTVTDKEVLAWMPLPESAKIGDEK